MYSGYGGSPSRTLSTMSLSARPVRRLTSRSITRSQSFTGVNTRDKYCRSLSVFNTPGISRKPSRASRMFTVSSKSNPPPKTPQPERVDEVFEALRKGLQSYLQVHQMELDSLSRQIKESKRNSRLGFLYDMDKQVKVTERFIRRLEFHLSKIEELYEAYCLQRRLRDGADKMVKAYTESSISKEARESLAEASRGYREYTENMCVMESELENQLGEFHIKMKGLAGFARLCAGDQYEIFMKYGRQRWKLRGRIEINGKQVWDGDDMLFLPLINDFLSVKVTELKSLANHVVVGSVSCETKDLFAALPQTVAVDINDLGTIKLSLEVTWNPFDKDDSGSVASSVNKAPSVNKRFSTILNQTPPDTPSLREQAFYSLPRTLTRRHFWPLLDSFGQTLRQRCSCSNHLPARPSANMLRHHEELENGTAWSNSSESSDDSSSPRLSAVGQRNSTHQKVMAVTPGAQSCSHQPDVSFHPGDASTPNTHYKTKTISEAPNTSQPKAESSQRDEKKVMVTTVGQPGSEDSGKRSPLVTVDSAVANSHSSHGYSRSLSHISESSTDGLVLTDRSESGEVVSPVSRTSVSSIEIVLTNRTSEASGSVGAGASPKRLSVVKEIPKTDITDPKPAEEEQRTEDTERPSQTNAVLSEGADVTYVARRVAVVEEAPRADTEEDGPVDSGLEDALGAVVSALDDYRGQFPELQLLEQELMLLQVTLKGGRNSRSPSVVSLTVETALGSFDFLNASDGEEEEAQCRNGRSLQDRAWDKTSSSSPTSPITTGSTMLDCSLVVHLKNCNSQLLRLGTFGPLRCGEMYALDRLLRETRVFEIIRGIAKDDPRRSRQPAEVIPQLDLCQGAVLLWQQSVGRGSVYSVSAETFLASLVALYSTKLPERASNMADTVFLCLLERVLDQRLPRRGTSRRKVKVTVFQLWSYLDANDVSDLDAHVSELADEVWLIQSLASCDQDVIIQTLRRPPESSLKREGLHAVVRLLKDPRAKVSASASSVLRSVATQPKHREQALVGCLELLEDDNVDTRICACKGLACLKAKESIDQLVYLCQTDKDEVRDAAKQALLVLGEEGRMAHRHVETSQGGIPRIFAPGSMASTAF